MGQDQEAIARRWKKRKRDESGSGSRQKEAVQKMQGRIGKRYGN